MMIERGHDGSWWNGWRTAFRLRLHLISWSVKNQEDIRHHRTRMLLIVAHVARCWWWLSTMIDGWVCDLGILGIFLGDRMLFGWAGFRWMSWMTWTWSSSSSTGEPGAYSAGAYRTLARAWRWRCDGTTRRRYDRMTGWYDALARCAPSMNYQDEADDSECSAHPAYRSLLKLTEAYWCLWSLWSLWSLASLMVAYGLWYSLQLTAYVAYVAYSL